MMSSATVEILNDVIECCSGSGNRRYCQIPNDVIECCAVTRSPECCRHIEYRGAPPASLASLEPQYLPVLESEQLSAAHRS